MASEMARTCRSLGADASRNASVITSWSATSRMTISSAFLSAAAWAAVSASSTARSVAGTRLLPSPVAQTPASHARAGNAAPLRPRNGRTVQTTLSDVLHHPVGYEIPHRPALGDTLPAGGGGYRHGGYLDQPHGVRRQMGVGKLKAGPGDADEVRQAEHGLRFLPRQDALQRVG